MRARGAKKPGKNWKRHFIELSASPPTRHNNEHAVMLKAGAAMPVVKVTLPRKR